MKDHSVDEVKKMLVKLFAQTVQNANVGNGLGCPHNKIMLPT
jgi:hypothetical protein